MNRLSRCSRTSRFKDCLLLRTTACLLIGIALSGELPASQPLSSLLSKIPPMANAIVAVDAEQLRNSPLGKQENWAAANEAAYVNSPFLMPPESDLFLLASLMNPDSDFQQSWETAVMSLTESISMRSIARTEGGKIDELSGVPAVWSPSDAYFLSFSDDVLGVMSPSNRQLAARWIHATQASPQSQISPYLLDQVNKLSSSAQLVLAIDLDQAVNPFTLEEGLARSEFVIGDSKKQSAWQELIESLQGIALTVHVDTAIHGQLQIDFTQNPSVLGADAKAAVLSAFDRFGIHLDNLSQWKLTQTDTQLLFEGDMNTSDLRRIMSLLELPSAQRGLLSEETPAQPDEKDKVATSSQKYFQSVTTLLNDLEKEFRTNRDARDAFPRTYMQRYAKRIDQLPILNVDNDLVAYGLKVSETLRSVSVTQGSTNVQAGVRSAGVATTSGYDAYGYGYSTSRTRSAQRTYINRQEQSDALEDRFRSWKEIQDAQAQIRVDMTQKYGLEF